VLLPNGSLFEHVAGSSTASFPTGIAIDQSNNAWIANIGDGVSGQGGAVELAPDGTKLHDFNGPLLPSGANFAQPVGIAIDRSGLIWASNTGDASVTKFSADGVSVQNLTNANTAGANFQSPVGIAFDSASNAWIANSNGSTVTQIATGGLVNNFTNSNLPPAAFSTPWGLAVDSADNVWVVNAGGSVSELKSSPASRVNLDPPGANFSTPHNIAIDSAGNAWVTNTSSITATELVGIASPVKAPLSTKGPLKPIVPCIPKTCADFPPGTCGPVADVCGGTTANCGSCSGGQACGAGGTPNKCAPLCASDTDCPADSPQCHANGFCGV